MILKTDEVEQLAKSLHKQNKSIVVVGGCFDIIHLGHVRFLNHAKEQGNVLFVLVENDATIKNAKGNERPINTQMQRAEVLIGLKSVDYVILLPPLCKDSDYDDIITRLKPDIIAVTSNDPNKAHKERQAMITGAKIIEVIKRINNQSTTRLARLLSETK